MKTKISQNNFVSKFRLKNLPLYVLIVGLTIKFICFLSFPVHYWYDEIVVTQISKQPLSLLLDTIKAEPHPPGFYLFLKLFSVDNPLETKVLLTLISLGITLIAILYAKRHNLIQRNKLTIGLAFFFSSYSYLRIASDVKQDVLSFPILLFTIFILTNFLQNKIKGKSLFMINILLCLLLLLGYIPYFIALAILIYVTASKKNRLLSATLIAQLSLLTLYVRFWGFQQFLINKERFSWLAENSNDILSALSMHLTGRPLDLSSTFFPVLATLLLVGIAYLYFGRSSKLQKKVLLIVPIVLVFAYLTNSLVRTRYVLFLLLLIQLVTGWGLLQLKIYKKLVFPLLGMFTLMSATGYIVDITSFSRYYSILSDVIIVNTQGHKVGFIYENGLYPFSLTLSEFKNSNLVPINVFQLDIFKGSTTIERKHLMLEAKGHDLDFDETRRAFLHSKLDSFIYIEQKKGDNAYFDPKNIMKKVLVEECKNQSAHQVTNNNLIIYFENCLFEE